ncbi:MAG: YraN family protein [Candidatus Wallbacteria bacterium]
MRQYNSGQDLNYNKTGKIKITGKHKNLCKIIGNQGEETACDFLRKEKYFILKRNFRTRTGEIDIIAYKAHTIYFFEVKTRRRTICGHPDESVNGLKIHKINLTAQHFLNFNPKLADFNIYFGLISIYTAGNQNEIKIIPFEPAW